MSIYRKIGRFVRPFVPHLLLSILLTFTYAILNNVSLWVSVDFIGELFPSSQPAVEATADSLQIAVATDSLTLATVDTLTSSTDSTAAVGGQSVLSASPQNKLLNQALGDHKKLYKSLKRNIRSFLIRDTQRETLQWICVVIFISFVLKNICDYFRRLINRWIQLRVVVDLRNELQATAMQLPMSFFTQSHTGRLTSVVFNDVKAVRQVLNNSFGKMILTPIQILTNIFILVIMSWKLSLITFIIIPISSLIIFKIGQSMRRKSRRVLKQISEVMMLFQEAVASIQVVKSFTSERSEISKFREANRIFLRKEIRARRLGQATSPLNETAAVTILITLLWYGGNLVYKGEMMADDFVRYLIFLFASLQPLRELSGLNNIIQRGVAAAERIFEVLETEPEDYGDGERPALTDFDHGIELNNVSFNYHEDGPAILKNVNLSIQKGQTVAFVGHSGSGKTTLVNLIPRFYDVDAGKVLVDGQNITQVDLISLRKLIGMVNQDTMLFNDSIRHNIAYGCGEVEEAAIIEAAKAANAWGFISEMEGGLDAVVGERGANLSGGQKQRLSIARAILKNPPILILDEATSALDTESEKLVQDAIDAIMKQRTVLVIAHRLSTVIHADKIVVLNQGEIVGQGRHSELLESCAIYRNLYEIQFQDPPRDSDD